MFPPSIFSSSQIFHPIGQFLFSRADLVEIRVAVRDRRTGDCIVDQTLRLQNLPKLFRVDDDATAVSKNNPIMIKFIEVFRNLLT